INSEREDPVEALTGRTRGIGVDRAIDAVGVDAECPHHTPQPQAAQFRQEMAQAAPDTHPDGANWHPGSAPSQALQWAVEALAKAGTLSIIGVYPQQARSFPIGVAMNKNLTINMGNCHHRKYIPRLIELVQEGRIDPARILTQVAPMSDALEAFRAFDRRDEGWVKVELHPQMQAGLEQQREAEEELLDEAIEDSFPASDPPAMTVPKRS